MIFRPLTVCSSAEIHLAKNASYVIPFLSILSSLWLVSASSLFCSVLHKRNLPSFHFSRSKPRPLCSPLQTTHKAALLLTSAAWIIHPAHCATSCNIPTFSPPADAWMDTLHTPQGASTGIRSLSPPIKYLAGEDGESRRAFLAKSVFKARISWNI